MPHLSVLKVLSDAEDEQLNLVRLQHESVVSAQTGYDRPATVTTIVSPRF
jgi:hypothetical protein